jgi:DnaJ-class molecular chaperone
MTIKGEGMPLHNFASERGDLVVTFKVKFPSSFTEKQLEVLKSVFPEA